MVWEASTGMSRPYLWKLINHSLEAKGVYEKNSGKIITLFNINIDSTDAVTVWEAFKAYIWG